MQATKATVDGLVAISGCTPAAGTAQLVPVSTVDGQGVYRRSQWVSAVPGSLVSGGHKPLKRADPPLDNAQSTSRSA
jgi:hypothetical protein